MPRPPTYDQAIREVRARIRATVPPAVLRQLHARSGARHAAVALGQLVLFAACAALVLAGGERAWLWIPGVIGLGLALFSLTVLLHEVVHGLVTESRRPGLRTVMAWLYALPSGLSPTQFARWHLDHHQWLGTDDLDPKRAELSPRPNRRWRKALYLTPALFPIYFRAARRAAAAYPTEVKRRIRRERTLATTFHLGLLATLAWTLGTTAALRLYVLPVFFVFPVAFTLNRLGQHYDIDPTDPTRWGTRLVPSPWLWDRIFLWSNYHLEHHLFPGVPCYRLPALARALDPYLDAQRVRRRGYGGLLRDWILANRAPHTDWSKPPVGAAEKGNSAWAG